jgi:uncharacterized membrane protein
MVMLVATVVPWAISSTSSLVTPAILQICSTPWITPIDWSRGVLGTL